MFTDNFILEFKAFSLILTLNEPYSKTFSFFQKKKKLISKLEIILQAPMKKAHQNAYSVYQKHHKVSKRKKRTQKKKKSFFPLLGP